MADAGRVISGRAAGLRLAAPGEGTRPFGDRVKQALFGTLEADPDEPLGGPFLDLFAGSGAAGIEALSRGAPTAVFVERDAGAARVIADNLRRTALEGGRVVRADVLRFLDGDAGRRRGTVLGGGRRPALRRHGRSSRRRSRGWPTPIEPGCCRGRWSWPSTPGAGDRSAAWAASSGAASAGSATRP